MSNENEIKIDEKDKVETLEQLGEEVAPELTDKQEVKETEEAKEAEETMSFTDAVDGLTSVYVMKLLQLEEMYGCKNGKINFVAETNEGRIFTINVNVRSNKASKDSKENQVPSKTKSTKKPVVKKASKKIPSKKKATKKVAAKKVVKKKTAKKAAKKK